MRTVRTSKGILMRAVGLLAVVALLSSCTGMDSVPQRSAAVFRLTSPGLPDNGVLPQKHAGKNKADPNCAGANRSPPLQWFNAPVKTVSYVLLMRNQAGRAGLGEVHWIAYGIPAEATALDEGAGSAASQYIVRGKGSQGSEFYSGPCPLDGDTPQHYVFTLIATDLNIEALKPGLTETELMPYLKGHVLSAASFVLRNAQ